MSLLCYFCDQFVALEIITADVTAVFVNSQRGIQRREQDFDKSTYKYTQHTQLHAQKN